LNSSGNGFCLFLRIIGKTALKIDKPLIFNNFILTNQTNRIISVKKDSWQNENRMVNLISRQETK